MRTPTAIPVFAAILVIALAPAAQACRENIKFKNKTGVTVNDLHIEFNRGVDVTDAGAFGDNSGQNGNGSHDLSGGSVANGDSTEIDVTSEPCDNIKIKRWWWTVDGEPTGGKKIGEPIASVQAGGGNAAGGGLIRVRIDAVNHHFNTQPGAPPNATMAQFNAFLASILDDETRPLIHVTFQSPATVAFAGNVLGDPASELVVELLAQDPGQEITVINGSTAVPGQSAGGMALLLVALAGMTTIVLRRRPQRHPA